LVKKKLASFYNLRLVAPYHLLFGDQQHTCLVRCFDLLNNVFDWDGNADNGIKDKIMLNRISNILSLKENDKGHILLTSPASSVHSSLTSRLR
jgi:hypothetical protein